MVLHHAEDLEDAREAALAGLGLFVLAAGGEELVDEDGGMTRGDAQDDVPVEAIVQVAPQPLNLVPGRAAEEGGGLEDVVESFREGAPIQREVAAAERNGDGRAVVVAQAVADEESGLRPRLVGAGDRPQRALEVEVVRVEPGQDVTLAAARAFVDGGRLAAVGPARPVGQPAFERPDHVQGLVGRSAVHHHDLEPRIVLPEDAVESLPEVSPLVERGDDDPDRGQRGGQWGQETRSRSIRSAASIARLTRTTSQGQATPWYDRGLPSSMTAQA